MAAMISSVLPARTQASMASNSRARSGVCSGSVTTSRLPVRGSASPARIEFVESVAAGSRRAPAMPQASG